jgi:hypothetical protein
MRHRVAFFVASVLVAAPSVAFAQSDCPPGSWFCEDQEAEADDGAADESAEADAEAGDSAPPVVVYEPAEKSKKAPDKIIVVERGDSPRPPKRRYRREWGFNLRLEGLLMGDSDREGPPKSDDARMGGLGFSLRYRPIPHFAFDAGLDFLGGVDWQGDRRNETALLLNAMIFFNPRSKAQIYMLGGIGFSGARVLREHDMAEPVVEDYAYFGGQLGLGLELRVGRKTALNLDVLGFLRGRTDDQARFDPEFVDPETGRATNTSGGGLIRGGVTFYW